MLKCEPQIAGIVYSGMVEEMAKLVEDLNYDCKGRMMAVRIENGNLNRWIASFRDDSCGREGNITTSIYTENIETLNIVNKCTISN